MAVTTTGNHLRINDVDTNANVIANDGTAKHGRIYLSNGSGCEIYIGNHDGSLSKLTAKATSTSVWGVSTTGYHDNIQATTDGHVLRRSGGVLGFGTITSSSISDVGTIIQGSGITLSGTLTNRLVGSGNLTIAHADTSSFSKSSLTGATVISNLTVDTYGHITDWTTRNLQISDIISIRSGELVYGTGTSVTSSNKYRVVDGEGIVSGDGIGIAYFGMYAGNGVNEGGALRIKRGSNFVTYIGSDCSAFGGNNDNTTIFAYGNNSVNIATNSVRRLIVDGNGYVTINNIPTAASATDILVSNGGVVSTRTVASLGIPVITPAALTKTDDTNVTISLGGTPATALLQGVSLTMGWAGVLAITRGGTGLGSLGTANQLLRVNTGETALEYFTPDWTSNTGTVTSFSAGNLSPLFTTNVATPTTTPALSFNLSNCNQYQVFGRVVAGTGAPSYVSLNPIAFNGLAIPNREVVFGTGTGVSSSSGFKYTTLGSVQIGTGTATGTYSFQMGAGSVASNYTMNIGGGIVNNRGNYSLIISESGSEISGSENANLSVLLGGNNNKIIAGTSTYGNVILGASNTVTSTTKTTTYNRILGSDNTITDAYYNNILGISNNISSSGAYSAYYNDIIGYSNSISGTTSNAYHNKIIGVSNTISNGGYNNIIGRYCNNGGYSGTIMLGDGGSSTITATASDQFNSRFNGGYRFMQNGTTQWLAIAPTTGYVTINNIPTASGATDILVSNSGVVSTRTLASLNIPVVTPAALTKTDDTNVTLSLGGTPATALLQGVSLTLGWTGILAIGRGGTGLGTLGTVNQLLRVNSGGTALEYFSPTWTSNTGTVTSVAASVGGTALGVSGTPITSSGTLAFSWTGTSGQYVRGDGVLQAFPTIPSVAGKYVALSDADAGYSGQLSAVNLNDYTKTQVIYSNGNVTNNPNANSYVVWIGSGANTYGAQMAINPSVSDKFFFRNNYNTSWSSWYQVASREWVISQNYLTSGSGNAVWKIQGGSTDATTNTQNIYHNANVWLGDGSGSSSSYRLHVSGISYFTGYVTINNIPTAASATDILVSNGGVVSTRSLSSLNIPTALWQDSGGYIEPLSNSWIQLKPVVGKGSVRLSSDNDSGIIEVFNDDSSQTLTIKSDSNDDVSYNIKTGKTHKFNEKISIGYIPTNTTSTSYLVDNSGVIEKRSLPIASSSTLGVIKIGDTLQIDGNGVVNTYLQDDFVYDFRSTDVTNNSDSTLVEAMSIPLSVGLWEVNIIAGYKFETTSTGARIIMNYSDHGFTMHGKLAATINSNNSEITSKTASSGMNISSVNTANSEYALTGKIIILATVAGDLSLSFLSLTNGSTVTIMQYSAMTARKLNTHAP